MKKYNIVAFLIITLFFLPRVYLYAESYVKYKDASLPIETRVQDLLSKMTLDEKIAQMRHVHAYSILDKNGNIDKKKLDGLIKGRSMGFIEGLTLPGKECRLLMSEAQKYMQEKTRLGIPLFALTESLHGSVHDGSTIFPQAIALGSTFNPELAYQMTSAISSELSAQCINQSLTPILDVCRDLRWGRVEECFGEDPFLVTQIGVAQVKGYLDHGISPMLKHFGAHAQPQGGLNLSSVACGKRDLLSIFLKPFETVIKEAKPWAVMSSYNSWNHEPNSSSYYLLTELLRKQWGFKGYVYSDWGSIGMLSYFHHTARNGAEAAIQALTAGLDAEASDNSFNELKQLIENEILDEKYVDEAVSRILRAKFAMGLFDNKKPLDNYDEIVHNNKHVNLARKIAEESIILMKNENNILPLDVDKLKSIAVIGPNANKVQFGDYTWSRNNKDGITLLDALQNKIGDKVKINYAKGCDLITDNKDGFNDAIQAVNKSDISIVVVGSASASLARDYSNSTCGEGFDLSDLNLTGAQGDLIEEIHKTGKPVVVVLLSGKPFAMQYVKDNIEGFIVQWYPGEEGGNALADVLLGKVNPSGHLNYSFPKSVGHLPCFYNYLPSDKGFYHKPGEKNKPGKDYVFSSPKSLWSFGHGLSYTEFEYISAETSKKDYSKNDVIEIIVTIRNIGNYDGMEVPQVYVRDVVSSVVTPIKELKGFKKVFIKQGELKKIKIDIPVSELALYNKNMERVVEPGSFELQIGRSSDDIRIKKMITVERNLEKVIPTLKDQAKNNDLSKHIDIARVTVKGTVRDVQANALKNISIKVNDKEVLTDIKGNFKINAMSNDTLIVSGKGYKSREIPIQGRQLINVRLITIAYNETSIFNKFIPSPTSIL